MKGGIVLKSKNLQTLKKNQINVPNFHVIHSISDDKQHLVVEINNKKHFMPINSFIEMLNSDYYAVRSSCAAEDNINNSYAGQFETILNVKRLDIPSAIEKVFNSYNNENLFYYNQNHVSIQNNTVIVQEMVQPDIAGVMFTANPNGLLNEIVITVGLGLGSGIVEDKVDTTTYYYNVDDRHFYSEHVCQNVQLDKDVLNELVRIGKQIKLIFKQECDIEFCIQNNNIYILQARPITTIPDAEIIVLDNSNIVESYPGISLPLTQDFVKEIYHDIFYNCLTRVSEDESIAKNNDRVLQKMVDVANWGMYYRINNWYSILKLLPCSSFIIPIWQRMLGVKNKDVLINPEFKTSILMKTKMFFMFFKYLHLSPKLMRSLNDNFNQMFIELSNEINRATNVQDLIDTYYKVKAIALKDWDITLINDMYAFIYTGLAGKRSETKISSIKNLESMKPILSVERLVQIKQQYGHISKEYKSAFEKHIELYGDRCIGELKLETPTYRTNPELLEQYISNYSPVHMAKPQHSNEHLGFFVKRAKIGIENREISRLNRSRLFGLVRGLFRKAGSMLVEQGKLLSIEDVFYLHINEITSSCNLIDLVQRRKDEEQVYNNIPRFERLIYAGKIFDKTCILDTFKENHNQNILRGIPTSFGKIKAEVVVLDGVNANIDTSGKIIVTKTTDPGWVYLIKNAVGIIAEKGSLLSHTAIISRELQKPAVVNVENCTSILQTGEIVELDAEKGIIKRVSDE